MLNPLLRKLLSSPHFQHNDQEQQHNPLLDNNNSSSLHSNVNISTAVVYRYNNTSLGSNDSDSSYDPLFYDGDYFYGSNDADDSGCDAEDSLAIDFYLRFHTMVDVYANTAVGLLGIAANMIVIPILCR